MKGTASTKVSSTKCPRCEQVFSGDDFERTMALMGHKCADLRHKQAGTGGFYCSAQRKMESGRWNMSSYKWKNVTCEDCLKFKDPNKRLAHTKAKVAARPGPLGTITARNNEGARITCDVCYHQAKLPEHAQTRAPEGWGSFHHTLQSPRIASCPHDW